MSDGVETVHYNNIRQVWPVILPGVSEIVRRGRDLVLNWTQIDLLNELLNKRARLFMVFDDGEYAGFFVMRYLTREFSHEPYLHVWLVYLKPGKKLDIMAEVDRVAGEEGRRTGARVVEGTSPRAGWGRRLRLYQAKPYMTTYQKVLR